MDFTASESSPNPGVARALDARALRGRPLSESEKESVAKNYVPTLRKVDRKRTAMMRRALNKGFYITEPKSLVGREATELNIKVKASLTPAGKIVMKSSTSSKKAPAIKKDATSKPKARKGSKKSKKASS